ncbi:helix-turn-helix domain-containing protein [Jiangella anatolica]|uniref:helix-turn-helix domain-containing protein n=1 Tax=Jiangella anatolica TaxID=2670374 RepID=UPI000DA89F56|nr:helix-turn-helix domain-containing protein [Jiangella anatolica]
MTDSTTAEALRPGGHRRHPCRQLGLTEAALREATRRAAGCRPKEFILRARLTRAKELLAATDLPVAAVPARTG